MNLITVLGWISLVIVALAVLSNLANNKLSGGQRVFATTFNTIILLYIVLTLF
jgi:hypothetical protein